MKALIVQVTGEEKASRTVNLIAKSFKALDSFADHDATSEDHADADSREEEGDEESLGRDGKPKLGLNYTINLQLPATSDVAVFNAIFKSLRDHLLT